MRILPFLAACCAVAIVVPAARAQMAINAPVGWSEQTEAGGAHLFSPTDLGRGEIYSATVYDSAALDGKTLEEYLRAFAGTVGKAPGHLTAPLKVETSEGRTVTGAGLYNGPRGTSLGVVFIGVSLDGGANIHVERLLFAGPDSLIGRYAEGQKTLLNEMIARAKAEAGDNLHHTPARVLQHLTPGGELVPGVYAGNQYVGQELRFRFHLYIFPSREYRLCDQNDRDMTRRFFDEETGNVGYNRNTGELSVGYMYSMSNSSVVINGEGDFCYYGRDASGKPAIYAQEDKGFDVAVTSLTYIGPAVKRVSKAQEAEVKAAAEAEKNRYKWVTAPGRGVQNAQIAAILCNSQFNGGSATTDTYLLFKDGSVYADLPVPPDELDTQKSKQREPDKWGRWRRGLKGDYLVSWNGAKYESLPGFAVVPAPAQTKLQGRWGTGSSSGVIGMTSSYALWGVSFNRAGRFSKDSRGGTSSTFGFGDDATHVNSGYDENGSFASSSGPSFVVSSETKKKNPNGAREGDYSLNGWVLTLRYDNGKVARLPFYFFDNTHKTIYFEGSTMSKDDQK